MYILEINWAWETSIWNFPQLSTSFYCKDLVLDEFPCRSCDADNIETWSRSSMARTGCLSHDGMAGWNWMKLLHKKRNHMENKTRKTLNRSIKSIHISHQHSRPNPADFMRLQGQHLVCVQLVKFTSGVNCDRITRSMLRRIWRRVLRSEVIGLCLLLGRTQTCSFYLLLAYTLRPSLLVHFRKPRKASWMTTKITTSRYLMNFPHLESFWIQMNSKIGEWVYVHDRLVADMAVCILALSPTSLQCG